MCCLRRWMCVVMILALCMNFMPGAVFAAQTQPTEAITESTEATTEPAEVITEPSSEPTAEPTEPATDPTEASAEPTQEPTEATTESTQETTEPSTEPTEATTEPTEAPTEPTEETIFLTEPEDPVQEEPKGWGLYFGQLHSHSTISDSTASVNTLYAQAQTAGLDFFAVTDHGDSISGADSASLTQDMKETSTDWAEGKAAAEAATCRDFVGIYGFEMSWPGEKRIGHIATLNTSGFASWQQPAFSQSVQGLEDYAAALAGAGGSVSQFCHPGTQHGDFLGFSQYSALVDSQVQLLEVGTGKNPYRYYTQALDYGWHVAPVCNQINRYGDWSDFSVGRTVIWASSLTEEGIYEAIRSHRVYATQDCDLHITFSQMGTRLARRNVGRELTLSAGLSDATGPVGKVEVITSGGEAIAAQTLEGFSGEVSFTLPSTYPYYYLRVTQPDGDTAVTAPVWLEGETDVGISSFLCETELPLQGRPITLTLTLHNGDPADLLVEKMEFSLEDQIFHVTQEPMTIPAGEEATYSLSPTLYALGAAQIRVRVTATLEGQSRNYEKTLSLSFRRDDMVTDILVDAAHGNAGVEELSALTLLAADNRVGLTYARQEATAEMLAKAGIFLVTAPKEPFSEEFVQNTAAFALHGGTVILCGQSVTKDREGTSAQQLNRILAAAGASMTLGTDAVLDDVHNGGENTQLYPVNIHREISWCRQVTENQVYRNLDGCSVSGGTWLVKGHDTAYSSVQSGVPVVLAWEKAEQGNLFAAGSLWLLEEELAPPKNVWDEPYANRTILEAIFGVAPPEIPLRSIGEVRKGAEGTVCRIRGYVTAGTSRPGNRFPETLYLQDDTGGIPVMPVSGEELSLGTAMEVTGYLKQEGKNKQFHPISWELLDTYAYRFTGLTGQYRELLDNSRNGGRLVQLQGIVERVELTEEGTLSQILLRDEEKNYATLLVEPYILSGSTGENTLAQEIQPGQEVRAMGLVHMHSDGTAVARVRNCDEVVVIDPWPYTPDRVWKVRDKSNPNCGDPIGTWAAAMALSGGVLLLRKRRR